jgi:hypothetical protein
VSAENLIARLEKCKRTGAGTWLACCPAHEDRSPSMSIREMEDGRVLVHCFAGCGVDSILGAVGLEFDALFPPKPIEHAPRVRRPYPAADVLEALASEAQLVAVAACNLGNGAELTQGDRERLLVAQARIEEARRLALG